MKLMCIYVYLIDNLIRLQELVTSLKTEVEENKEFGLEPIEY